MAQVDSEADAVIVDLKKPLYFVRPVLHVHAGAEDIAAATHARELGSDWVVAAANATVRVDLMGLQIGAGYFAKFARLKNEVGCSFAFALEALEGDVVDTWAAGSSIFVGFMAALFIEELDELFGAVCVEHIAGFFDELDVKKIGLSFEALTFGDQAFKVDFDTIVHHCDEWERNSKLSAIG